MVKISQKCKLAMEGLVFTKPGPEGIYHISNILYRECLVYTFWSGISLYFKLNSVYLFILTKLGILYILN